MTLSEHEVMEALLPLGFNKVQIRAAYKICDGSSVDAVIECILNLSDVVSDVSGLSAQEVDCKMVIVVQADMNMSAGKIASQCCHAVLGAYRELQSSEYLNMWLNQGEPIVICKTASGMNLGQLKQQCSIAGLPAHIVQDAGRTQVASGSKTVMAIGPAPIAKIDEVTRSLRLL